MTWGISLQAYLVLPKSSEGNGDLSLYDLLVMVKAGSMVSHEKGHFLYCYIDGFAILVFRSG